MGRVILLTCLAFGLATIAQAADEPTLEERVAAIDRVVAQPDGMRVVLGHISRELHVSAEDLRTQGAQTGLGLGEILIANRLAADTRLSVEQIVHEFQGGRSWTQIATDHAVDLAAATRYVADAQDAVEQRSDDKGPAAHGGDATPQRSRGGGGHRAGGGGMLRH